MSVTVNRMLKNEKVGNKLNRKTSETTKNHRKNQKRAAQLEAVLTQLDSITSDLNRCEPSHQNNGLLFLLSAFSKGFFFFLKFFFEKMGRMEEKVRKWDT